jgi:hypothetical protein
MNVQKVLLSHSRATYGQLAEGVLRLNGTGDFGDFDVLQSDSHDDFLGWLVEMKLYARKKKKRR